VSTVRHSLSAPPGIGIRFKTGIKAAIDIKAELTAVSGKIRFKIMTSPEMPFVSKVTIAFTNVPTIETGVMPLTKHMNIMHLPLIKALVNEGVKLGFAGLVDPKSMTLDVQALLGTAAHDTTAIGVVKVDFIEAIRTSKSIQEMEDSYGSLSLSNSPGRSMSTTRVLTNDKDPRWNESLYLLVHEGKIFDITYCS
jgi:Ca2+-dependent lipid-binding protein